MNPTADSTPIKVACVGDSITEGKSLGKRTYPDQLQEMLGDKWKVGNFGVSGRTLLKKGDFPYWSEMAYKNAIDFDPQVVIIMLGTNDAKTANFEHQKEFSEDYAELVKSFQNLASKPRIYLCRPSPVREPGAFTIKPKNLEVFRKKIDALAKEMKLDVIDMERALSGKEPLLPDRVHPNEEGAGELAKAAFKALTGKRRTGL
ncbi:MAG: GDSL-type esterase/lipase family protein [Luteolibacter sp.]